MIQKSLPTFVKICGITQSSEAQAAVRAGANAVGFVFAPGPRRVSVASATKIAAHVHPSVLKIGVFVNSAVEAIEANVDAAGLDGVQLHGSEPPEVALRLKESFPQLLVIKAIKMNGKGALAEAERYSNFVDVLMFDPKDVNHPERRAQPLPLDWLAALPPGDVIVAGGLSPQNVSEVVRTVRPWGVDASGSLEIRPGTKDPSKITAFVRAVREAEEST